MNGHLENKNTILGNRIREARERVGKNQSEFAELIGVMPTHLNRWEKGKVSPGWDYLVLIAKHCNISLDWLLTGVGEEEQKLEVYDLAPATMNIDGEQTYMTNQGPMAFSDICSSMGISPNDFTVWIRTHHKKLREKYRNIEKLIREENHTTESSLDPRLIVLHNQLEYLYKEGGIDERARVRGLIEELYDEIIRRKESQKKEEVVAQKKAG